MNESRKEQVRAFMLRTFKDQANPEQGDVYIYCSGPAPDSDEAFLTRDDTKGAFFNAAYNEDGIAFGLVSWRKEDAKMASQAMMDYIKQGEKFLTIEKQAIIQPKLP